MPVPPEFKGYQAGDIARTRSRQLGIDPQTEESLELMDEGLEKPYFAPLRRSTKDDAGPPEPVRLNPAEEAAFQHDYAEMVRTKAPHLNPDPDAPGQKYDYRAAWKAMEMSPDPEQDLHFSSEFKHPDHPNRFVTDAAGVQFDTMADQPVGPVEPDYRPEFNEMAEDMGLPPAEDVPGEVAQAMPWDESATAAPDDPEKDAAEEESARVYDGSLRPQKEEWGKLDKTVEFGRLPPDVQQEIASLYENQPKFKETGVGDIGAAVRASGKFREILDQRDEAFRRLLESGKITDRGHAAKLAHFTVFEREYEVGDRTRQTAPPVDPMGGRRDITVAGMEFEAGGLVESAGTVMFKGAIAPFTTKKYRDAAASLKTHGWIEGAGMLVAGLVPTAAAAALSIAPVPGARVLSTALLLGAYGAASYNAHADEFPSWEFTDPDKLDASKAVQWMMVGSEAIMELLPLEALGAAARDGARKSISGILRGMVDGDKAKTMNEIRKLFRNHGTTMAKAASVGGASEAFEEFTIGVLDAWMPYELGLISKEEFADRIASLPEAGLSGGAGGSLFGAAFSALGIPNTRRMRARYLAHLSLDPSKRDALQEYLDTEGTPSRGDFNKMLGVTVQTSKKTRDDAKDILRTIAEEPDSDLDPRTKPEREEAGEAASREIAAVAGDVPVLAPKPRRRGKKPPVETAEAPAKEQEAEAAPAEEAEAPDEDFKFMRGLPEEIPDEERGVTGEQQAPLSDAEQKEEDDRIRNAAVGDLVGNEEDFERALRLANRDVDVERELELIEAARESHPELLTKLYPDPEDSTKSVMEDSPDEEGIKRNVKGVESRIRKAVAALTKPADLTVSHLRDLLRQIRLHRALRKKADPSAETSLHLASPVTEDAILSLISEYERREAAGETQAATEGMQVGPPTPGVREDRPAAPLTDEQREERVWGLLKALHRAGATTEVWGEVDARIQQERVNRGLPTETLGQEDLHRRLTEFGDGRLVSRDKVLKPGWISEARDAFENPDLDLDEREAARGELVGRYNALLVAKDGLSQQEAEDRYAAMNDPDLPPYEEGLRYVVMPPARRSLQGEREDDARAKRHRDAVRRYDKVKHVHTKNGKIEDLKRKLVAIRDMVANAPPGAAVRRTMLQVASLIENRLRAEGEDIPSATPIEESSLLTGEEAVEKSEFARPNFGDTRPRNLASSYSWARETGNTLVELTSIEEVLIHHPGRVNELLGIDPVEARVRARALRFTHKLGERRRDGTREEWLEYMGQPSIREYSGQIEPWVEDVYEQLTPEQKDAVKAHEDRGLTRARAIQAALGDSFLREAMPEPPTVEQQLSRFQETIRNAAIGKGMPKWRGAEAVLTQMPRERMTTTERRIVDKIKKRLDVEIVFVEGLPLSWRAFGWVHGLDSRQRIYINAKDVGRGDRTFEGLIISTIVHELSHNSENSDLWQELVDALPRRLLRICARERYDFERVQAIKRDEDQDFPFTFDEWLNTEKGLSEAVAHTVQNFPKEVFRAIGIHGSIDLWGRVREVIRKTAESLGIGPNTKEGRAAKSIERHFVRLSRERRAEVKERQARANRLSATMMLSETVNKRFADILERRGVSAINNGVTEVLTSNWSDLSWKDKRTAVEDLLLNSPEYGEALENWRLSQIISTSDEVSADLEIIGHQVEAASVVIEAVNRLRRSESPSLDRNKHLELDREERELKRYIAEGVLGSDFFEQDVGQAEHNETVRDMVGGPDSRIVPGWNSMTLAEKQENIERIKRAVGYPEMPFFASDFRANPNRLFEMNESWRQMGAEERKELVRILADSLNALLLPIHGVGGENVDRVTHRAGLLREQWLEAFPGMRETLDDDPQAANELLLKQYIEKAIDWYINHDEGWQSFLNFAQGLDDEGGGLADQLRPEGLQPRHPVSAVHRMASGMGEGFTHPIWHMVRMFNLTTDQIQAVYSGSIATEAERDAIASGGRYNKIARGMIGADTNEGRLGRWDTLSELTRRPRAFWMIASRAIEGGPSVEDMIRQTMDDGDTPQERATSLAMLFWELGNTTFGMETPGVWVDSPFDQLSPELVVEEIASHILDNLGDPANADARVFGSNLEGILDEIDALGRWFEQRAYSSSYWENGAGGRELNDDLTLTDAAIVGATFWFNARRLSGYDSPRYRFDIDESLRPFERSLATAPEEVVAELEEEFVQRVQERLQEAARALPPNEITTERLTPRPMIEVLNEVWAELANAFESVMEEQVIARKTVDPPASGHSLDLMSPARRKWFEMTREQREMLAAQAIRIEMINTTALAGVPELPHPRADAAVPPPSVVEQLVKVVNEMLDPAGPHRGTAGQYMQEGQFGEPEGSVEGLTPEQKETRAQLQIAAEEFGENATVEELVRIVHANLSYSGVTRPLAYTGVFTDWFQTGAMPWDLMSREDKWRAIASYDQWRRDTMRTPRIEGIRTDEYAAAIKWVDHRVRTLRKQFQTPPDVIMLLQAYFDLARHHKPGDFLDPSKSWITEHRIARRTAAAVGINNPIPLTDARPNEFWPDSWGTVPTSPSPLHPHLPGSVTQEERRKAVHAWALSHGDETLIAWLSLDDGNVDILIEHALEFVLGSSATRPLDISVADYLIMAADSILGFGDFKFLLMDDHRPMDQDKISELFEDMVEYEGIGQVTHDDFDIFTPDDVVNRPPGRDGKGILLSIARVLERRRSAGKPKLTLQQLANLWEEKKQEFAKSRESMTREQLAAAGELPMPRSPVPVASAPDPTARRTGARPARDPYRKRPSDKPIRTWIGKFLRRLILPHGVGPKEIHEIWRQVKGETDAIETRFEDTARGLARSIEELDQLINSASIWWSNQPGQSDTISIDDQINLKRYLRSKLIDYFSTGHWDENDGVLAFMTQEATDQILALRDDIRNGMFQIGERIKDVIPAWDPKNAKVGLRLAINEETGREEFELDAEVRVSNVQAVSNALQRTREMSQSTLEREASRGNDNARLRLDLQKKLKSVLKFMPEDPNIEARDGGTTYEHLSALLGVDLNSDQLTDEQINELLTLMLAGTDLKGKSKSLHWLRVIESRMLTHPESKGADTLPELKTVLTESLKGLGRELVLVEAVRRSAEVLRQMHIDGHPVIWKKDRAGKRTTVTGRPVHESGKLANPHVVDEVRMDRLPIVVEGRVRQAAGRMKLLAQALGDSENPIWLSRELAERLQEQIDQEDTYLGEFNTVLRVAILYNQMAKASKTVLSAAGIVRNFVSNHITALVAGHYPFTNPATRWRPNAGHLTQSGRAVRDLYRSLSKKEKEEIYQRYGIKGRSVMAEEMRAAISDIFDPDASAHLEGRVKLFKMIEAWFRKNFKFVSWGPKAAKGLMSAFARLFEIADTYWKMRGFWINLNKHVHRMGGDPRAILDDPASRSAAFDEAAVMLRDQYPDYSMTSSLFKKLRRFPVFGTYVSWHYETQRIQIMQARLAAQQVRDGKTAGEKVAGAVRLTKNLTLSGFAVGIEVAIAKEIINRLGSGVSDEEEEAMRLLMPDYWADVPFVAWKDGEGNLRFYQMGNIDPSAPWTQPVRGLIGDIKEMSATEATANDVFAAAWNAFKTWAGPTLDWEASAELMGQLIGSAKGTSKEPLWSQGDSPAKIGFEVVSFMYNQMEPGTIAQLEKVYEASELPEYPEIGLEESRFGLQEGLGAELAGLVAMRPQMMDPEVSVYYLARDWKMSRDKQVAKISNKLRRSAQWGGPFVEDAERLPAFKDWMEDLRKAQQLTDDRFIRKIEAARLLLGSRKVREILEGRLGKKSSDALMSGSGAGLHISKKTFEDILSETDPGAQRAAVRRAWRTVREQ